MVGTHPSFCDHGGGDGVIVSPDSHHLISRFKVHYELEHYVLGSCCGWMDHQYVEVKALDCVAHHQNFHLVLREPLFPSKQMAKYFCKPLKLRPCGELVFPRVVVIEDLGGGVLWVYPLRNLGPFISMVSSELDDSTIILLVGALG